MAIDGAKVVDFHCHIGTCQRLRMYDDLEDLIRVMDSAGVDMACLFNIHRGNASFGNDEVAKALARYPDRFVGFAFVTPYYPEEVENELLRAIDRLKMRAIKIYPPYFGRSVEDPAWEGIFKFANERGLTIISHTDVTGGPSNPSFFVPLAQKYKNVKWVLGHAGVTPPGRIEAIEAARKCSNIYLEICSSYSTFGSVEFLVNGAGEDRVLFGSDMPLMDPRIHLGRVMTADTSEEARHKVLGENALRLLYLG